MLLSCPAGVTGSCGPGCSVRLKLDDTGESAVGSSMYRAGTVACQVVSPCFPFPLGMRSSARAWSTLGFMWSRCLRNIPVPHLIIQYLDPSLSIVFPSIHAGLCSKFRMNMACPYRYFARGAIHRGVRGCFLRQLGLELCERSDYVAPEH